MIAVVLIVIFLQQAHQIRDDAIFTLTWMAGHCYALQNQCDSRKYDQWDHRSFTIRGLVPGRRTEYYYGSFDYKLFEGSDILKQMYNYWPPQPKSFGDPYYLWKDQWNDNGQRFAEIMLYQHSQLFNSTDRKVRNQQLQIDYFITSLRLYKQLNVKNLLQGSFTKGQFSHLIKIATDSFYFVCYNGVFREVRICLNFGTDGLTIRGCGSVRNNCPEKIVLLDWIKNIEPVKQQPPIDKKDKLSEQQYQKVIIPSLEQQEELLEDDLQKIEKIGQYTPLEVQIQVEDQKELIDSQVSEMKDVKPQNKISISELFQMVKGYIIATIVLVSIFWAAVIYIIFRTRRDINKIKKQKEVEESLKQMETNSFEMKETS